MRVLLTALVGVTLAVVGVALYTRYLGGRIGGTVTSWWRTPLHNTDVGGTAGSMHILGWAVDVTPATPSAEASARALGFPVVVNEGDHIHAAWWRA